MPGILSHHLSDDKSANPRLPLEGGDFKGLIA